MAVKQRKDGRWVCYYRARDGSGKIIYEYFGRGAEGQAAAQKRNTELGLHRYTPKKPKADGMPFWQLAKAYVQNKQFNENSKKHLKIRLKKNITPYFGNMIAEQLKHSDMDRYVKQRLGDGVKYSTISRELTDVKAILNWAARRQPPLITLNPVRDYEKPKPDDAVVFPPTTEELQAIMAAASEHVRRAVLLSYYTGLRPGAVELLSLTWGHVSWENQAIQILSAHKGGPMRRVVDLHADFIGRMETWHNADKALFREKDISARPIVHYHKKPVKKIGKAWKNTLERAGIKRRIRPYDLRHDFVTRLLEGGADIKTLSEIVGSAPATLMKHYQHVTNPMRKKTINSTPAITEIDRPHTRPYSESRAKKNIRNNPKK